MKVIVAGSRNIRLRSELVKEIFELCFKEVEEIVSGTCSGPDLAGERFGEDYGIPIKRFPPDWNKHGKAAGPIRNREMADYADALLLIWDGKSRGSKNMLSEAKKRGLRIVELIV